MIEQILYFIVNVTLIASIVLYYFLVIKPNWYAKRTIKQKNAENREAQREADSVLSQCPTYLRNCTDEMFSDTEIGYDLSVIKN